MTTLNDVGDFLAPQDEESNEEELFKEAEQELDEKGGGYKMIRLANDDKSFREYIVTDKPEEFVLAISRRYKNLNEQLPEMTELERRDLMVSDVDNGRIYKDTIYFYTTPYNDEGTTREKVNLYSVSQNTILSKKLKEGGESGFGEAFAKRKLELEHKTGVEETLARVAKPVEQNLDVLEGRSLETAVPIAKLSTNFKALLTQGGVDFMPIETINTKSGK